MKKYCLLLLLAVCAVLLLGCGSESQSHKNKGAGTLEMENVSANAGAEDVIVNVSLKNNPGFLTMAVMIDYDANALTLADVSCGEDYLDYMLNDRTFDNGPQLRNRYIHGSKYADSNQNMLDYYRLLKILSLVILKINEEFCRRDDIWNNYDN